MVKDDMVDVDLLFRDVVKEFYVKYEFKEVLGRWGELFYILFIFVSFFFFNIVRCIIVIKIIMNLESWVIK